MAKISYGLGYCPSKGDGSVAVYSLFIAAPIACEGSVFGTRLSIQYLMSFNVLQ